MIVKSTMKQPSRWWRVITGSRMIYVDLGKVRENCGSMGDLAGKGLCGIRKAIAWQHSSVNSWRTEAWAASWRLACSSCVAKRVRIRSQRVRNRQSDPSRSISGPRCCESWASIGRGWMVDWMKRIRLEFSSLPSQFLFDFS